MKVEEGRGYSFKEEGWGIEETPLPLSEQVWNEGGRELEERQVGGCSANRKPELDPVQTVVQGWGYLRRGVIQAAQVRPAHSLVLEMRRPLLGWSTGLL